MARNETFRKIESTAEKVSGGIIALLGVLSLSAPSVALGLGLYFIGRWRTPKKEGK
jgi:hypothetical protein